MEYVLKNKITKKYKGTKSGKIVDTYKFKHAIIFDSDLWSQFGFVLATSFPEYDDIPYEKEKKNIRKEKLMRLNEKVLENKS